MSADSSRIQALFFEGNRRMETGDAAGAEACYRQSLALDPNFAESLSNLGWLKMQQGMAAEAEACYRQALAIQPESVQTALNLGAMLMDRKCFADAEQVYRQALRLTPDSPAAWSNLGVLLACMKREAEAERCYRTALELDAGYAKAMFNLSYLLLRQGRFEEGWHCLEARDWYAALDKHFTCPRWRGEPLSGKSLVIGFEAGHGDMIQFCRYALNLKSMGASRIGVVCHPALKILFGTLSGVDAVFSFLEAFPASGWDYWTPPLSLPYYCKTRLDSIPAPIPYLSADPVRVARWSPLLPASGLRVGLAWKGNPRYENDADRSLPSRDILSPLGTVAGVQFISLQKDAGKDASCRPAAGLRLLTLDEANDDFSDTAAVIASLDLVISVDTAVAHLAGALGTPCWVLLPDYRTDWRWLADRPDSPWYPNTMTLFRQAPGGNWTSVIAAVSEALERRVTQSA
jgi:hypothetical protein